MPTPKVIRKLISINKSKTQNNIFNNRQSNDPPITRPLKHRVVKRESEPLDLPTAFGWEPLESTSKQIMKLLKDKNLPMIPYKAQRLLQKRTTVETSKRYPKVRRQPKINQGVEYETMLPMGYRGYDAVPAESRAPPQIEVNAAILERNMNFPSWENQFSDEDDEDYTEYDYEDFAEELKKHYSSKKQRLTKDPAVTQRPIVTHHHEQAHIQRYPDMQRQKIRQEFTDKPRPISPHRPPPKRRPRPPKTPARLHQRLTHPANRRSSLQQPQAPKHVQRLNHPANRKSSVQHIQAQSNDHRLKPTPNLKSPLKLPPEQNNQQRLNHAVTRKRPPHQPQSQNKQQFTPPPPAPLPAVSESPKAEKQFQEIQGSIPDENLLPTIYEPTSLQSILATHRIHTNVLRTRPRTQNVAYHATGDDVPPLEIERQDGPGTLDSPYYYSKDGEWEEVYPHSPMTLGKYQTMIEKSKKEQNDEERRQYHVRQQIESLQKEIEAERARNEELRLANDISKRTDTIEKEAKEEVESKPITKSIAETAILALTLGDKILQLYEKMEQAG